MFKILLLRLFLFYFQVVVPKTKGEILGVVIVESGWGSMLPTIVLANLSPGGPAARCGQLNIGDQVPTFYLEVVHILRNPARGGREGLRKLQNTT